MKLRTSLSLLVAGTAIPLILLAVVIGYALLDHENDTFRSGAQDRNRAFVSAMDAELRGHLTSLRALATSASLARDDLATFHADARRVLATQPDWAGVILADATGQQRVNTRVPFGEALPLAGDRPSFDRAVATGKETIGDITRGPRDNFAVPVRLPIVRDGVVRYVLTAPVEPRAFLRLIEEQRFPEGWAVGLIDGSGHFVARVPERPSGESASADFLAAIARTPEGWYRGRTLEGRDTFTAHRTSTWSGWTVGVAIPATHILNAAYRTALYTALGAIVLITVALAIAFAVGRRIAQPVSALAERARALAFGTLLPASPEPAAIDEVREVELALSEAAEAIIERETLRSREEVALKAADRAKDEFLAMLGHELRNPLSAITASAHVLRLARPGDRVAAQAHGVIERQTRQMTRLIEDLLDVSRLTMNKVSLNVEAFDLAELVAHAAATWLEAGQRPSSRLALAVSSAWVSGDRGRIEQVLTNLLDNADKFSPPARTIEVRVSPQGRHALLEVVDHGEGIAHDMLERIFDAFVQAPQDVSRSRGGMGLGLALVRRLVEMHGGSVSVHSDGPGHGARFTVQLPLIVPTPRGDVRRHASAASAQSRRILVVEDNDDGRAMLETMLQLEGHDVRSVATGAEGVAEAVAWRPDVALIDIGLPDIDGYEVARRIRAEPASSRVKLIALSGYGQSEDERRAYEAGFELHLTKPVAPDFLGSVLAAIVPAQTDPLHDAR